MPIVYDQIMKLESKNNVFSYGDRETMLYALGVGFGRDPMDEAELPYVYENNLKTVPTMATVISWGVPTMAKSGINYLMVVHGEQKITLHKPLPTAATIVADEKVTGVYDKGAGKGAVIYTEKVIRLKDSNEKLVTLVSSTFARGDGGFGGPTSGQPEPHPIPERKPDLTVSAETRPDQAFIYALSGDRNPLHRDPKIAQAAGFPRPIIHGLCTYGTACRALLKSVAAYDHTAITGFDVRFSAPVYPGETIVVDAWKDKNVVSFRAKVKERDIVVLNNGKCTLKA